jgi:LysM repeat protein
MNVLALVPFIFLGIGAFWALWLIFKQEDMAQSPVKLISYFLGVIITFAVVLWLVGQFLPWWTVRLLEDTRSSEEVQTIQNVGRQIWEDAMGSGGTQAEPTIYATTPTAATATPIPGGAQTAPQGIRAGDRVHVVQAGDTLYSIGRRYGVSADAIKQRNGLSSDTIRIGQELIIPAP